MTSGKMPTLSTYLQVPPKTINQESLYLVGIVTLISGFQLASFAKRVGQARRKYKIAPPKTDDDEAFVRCFRAQQNCLEFYPVFVVVTWITGIFFHQLPAAALAAFYLFERERYFVDYSRSSDERLSPFYRSALALRIMAFLSALGLFNVFIRQLFGRDLLHTIFDAVHVPF